MELGSSVLSLQKMFSISGQELVGELQDAKAVAAGLGVRGAGTSPPLHIVQCCCSEQASQEMKEWETLPAPVTHLLPPHRPGWLLRSRQGDQSSARNPHPSDSGIGIEELP